MTPWPLEFVPTPPPPLALVNIQLLWSGPDELTVIWSANHETLGRVWWGPRGEPATGLLEDEQFAVQHSLVVKGLDPAEWYAVQVAVIDRSSEFVVSQALFVKHDVGVAPPAAIDWSAAAAAGITAGVAVAVIRIRTVHRR